MRLRVNAGACYTAIVRHNTSWAANLGWMGNGAMSKERLFIRKGIIVVIVGIAIGFLYLYPITSVPTKYQGDLVGIRILALGPIVFGPPFWLLINFLDQREKEREVEEAQQQGHEPNDPSLPPLA